MGLPWVYHVHGNNINTKTQVWQYLKIASSKWIHQSLSLYDSIRSATYHEWIQMVTKNWLKCDPKFSEFSFFCPFFNPRISICNPSHVILPLVFSTNISWSCAKSTEGGRFWRSFMASRAESAVATSPGSCPNRIRREVPSEFLGIIWMVIFWIIWMVILWLFYGYSL